MGPDRSRDRRSGVAPSRRLPLSSLGWRTFDDAPSYRRWVEPHLLADEAANNLGLGILDSLTLPPVPDPAPLLSGVEADGAPVIALMMAAGHHLLIAGFSAPPGAVELAARSLAKTGLPVSGVQGPMDLVLPFADTWAACTGAHAHRTMEQRIYRLDAVTTFAPAPGALAVADRSHTGVLGEWMVAFSREAGIQRSADQSRARVQDFVDTGRAYLWVDEVPVCMAAVTRTTPRGANIGSVYTPPARRSRGYATSCVASLSRTLLRDGRSFCTLFADLANPTANEIYLRIGYVPVVDTLLVELTP